MKETTNIEKKKIYIFFLLYFLIGIYILRDYGIGIEEHFQRQNGFYWLKDILLYLNVDSLASQAFQKYQDIRANDPSLPNSDLFHSYGILFDVPASFIELIFKINDSKSYFEIRHLINFLIFFFSSIYFYKILKKRFSNNTIVYLGTFFYILNPRIFGDSFYNNKDIFFLSVLTIAIFFLFEFLEKNNYRNLILFCLFSAFATSSRIMGIYLPLLLIIFLFIEYLSNQISLNNFIKKKFFIIFFFIFFLYLHFPYMWELNPLKLIKWFEVYFYNMGFRILFNGEYYHMKYLPRLYLPVWILITTPIYILLLFLIGYFFMFKRFFQRTLKITLNSKSHNDFWVSINEKKDLFILISLTSFLIYAIFLNVAMLSGWRHFYFLHIFIVYISIFGLNLVSTIFKRKKLNAFFFKLVNLIFMCVLLTQIYLFHPYQSLYFNFFINKKNVLNFQVDTPSLSRSDALKYLVNINKDKKKLYVANASWTPFWNGKDLLDREAKEKLIFVGQEYKKADYIYTNFNYEVDPKFSKKYNIPKNFKEIKKVQINGIPIYSIFERIN